MCSLSIRTDFTRRRPNGTFKSRFAGVYKSREPPNGCTQIRKPNLIFFKKKKKNNTFCVTVSKTV